MVNYHILNSDEYVKTDDNGNEQSAEFVSSDYFIFPAEILMYLSVRERMGSTAYGSGKGGLLSLGINRMPDSGVEYPSGDIVDRVFDKLYKENPGYRKM